MRKIRLDEGLKRKLCLEVSKYALDLSKLIFGGVILTGIVNMSTDVSRLVAVGVLAVAITAVVGLALFIIGNHNKDTEGK